MELKPIPGERAAVLGKYLIVCDPHIGFELELWRQGIKVPFQTAKMAEHILTLADSQGISKVILNGDIKHEIAVYRGRQVDELEKFMAALREQLDVIFIKGNHDGGLEGEKLVEIGKHIVTHGHYFPSEEFFGKTWITGHVHPHISFRDDFGKRASLPVWVFGDVKGTVKTPIVVMPAFNSLRTGLDINTEKKKRGMISRLDNFSAFLLDGVEVLRVDSVDKSRKSDGLSDMFQFEHGHKKSLNTNTKPAVLDGTILP